MSTDKILEQLRAAIEKIEELKEAVSDLEDDKRTAEEQVESLQEELDEMQNSVESYGKIQGFGEISFKAEHPCDVWILEALGKLMEQPGRHNVVEYLQKLSDPLILKGFKSLLDLHTNLI